MGIALVIALMVLAVIGAAAAVLLGAIRKVDPMARDRTEDPDIQSAQEFLPFEDIRDDMILLGQHRYRAVLSCSSTNYYLKTAGEKEQIELSFQRFLNSITFPVTFFLQTKTIDNTARLASLRSEIEKTVSDFPGIRGYAEQYLQDMACLNERLGNNQQKRKYLIVTYDDAEALSQLTDEEKVVHAAREIRNRCAMIQSNLEAVGVTSSVMDTAQLIELIYSCYWRDDYSYAEEISAKDCFRLFVEGEEDRFRDMSAVKTVDLILGETISKMELSNLDAEPAGREVLRRLRDLRETCAGGTKGGIAG